MLNLMEMLPKENFSGSLDKLTIAEAVDLLRREGYEVTANKLRQYEKQGLLFPEKTQAKYRLYSDTNLIQARKILALISLGFSIKEVRSFNELADKVVEIIEQMSEMDKGIKESNKLNPEEMSDEDFKKWTFNHMSLIEKKWTNIETNKNCLIFSKFLSLYERAEDLIKNKKNMLQMLEKTFFKPTHKCVAVRVFEILKERTLIKPQR